jgi:hypothetical protein
MAKAAEPVKAPDLVTVTLPRATGKEEDTVFVALNGKGYTIRRGVPVRVPRAIYNILVESRRQQERQAAYEEKMQRQAEKNASLYGL